MTKEKKTKEKKSVVESTVEIIDGKEVLVTKVKGKVVSEQSI